MAAGGSPAAPSITTQPASQTVTVGQTATFSVVATGTAPLSYQWMKNGTAISGGTSLSYTAPATTSADNGSQFTAVVSNTAGSVTSNAATLTVNPAQPVQTTTTNLPARRVPAAHTATLHASAGTTPHTRYERKNDVKAISGGTSLSYTAPATTSADNGSQFTAVVSNTAGNVTSNAATLTVNPAQPLQITTTSLPAGRVQSAYSATLQASGGTSPYTWSVAGGQLPPGLTLGASGAISGTPTTAGQFTATIQVQDAAAHTASSAFTITVSTTGTMPQFGHVFIVEGENSAYSSTYNSSNMPYLTS